MMPNAINQSSTGSENITDVIQAKGFLSLDKDLQDKIVDSVNSRKEKDGGIMGRFLGTNTENSSIHISFILCACLLLIMSVDFVHAYCIGAEINMGLANVVVPVITLTIGYFFGKGNH